LEHLGRALKGRNSLCRRASTAWITASPSPITCGALSGHDRCGKSPSTHGVAMGWIVRPLRGRIENAQHQNWRFGLICLPPSPEVVIGEASPAGPIHCSVFGAAGLPASGRIGPRLATAESSVCTSLDSKMAPYTRFLGILAGRTSRVPPI